MIQFPDIYSKCERNSFPGTITATGLLVLYGNFVNGDARYDVIEPIIEQLDFDENQKFDFIVVGAGASGSVVANRLSENPKWNILLLEIGGEAPSLVEIPGLTSFLPFTNYSWQFYTEENERVCLSCPGRKMFWPQGRALGGTTNINYMIATRGNRLDYDKWSALGNPGWSYEDVLPYFLKSERANIQISDPGYHNRNGYLSVSDVPYRSESAWAYVNAARQAGYSYVDYNGANQFGVSFIQSTTSNGKRHSADRAFLNPVRRRRNLKILTNSRVVQVLIDPETKTAYGVRFVKDRLYHSVRARKEVILSAGALNSPQLLMLSGVGPKQHLREIGIPHIYDSPVGQKLQDHLAFFGLIYEFNQSIAINFEEAISKLPQYIFQRNGPLSSIGGVEAVVYTKSEDSYDPNFFPDVELVFLSIALNVDDGQGVRNLLGVSQETYDKVWKPLRKGRVCQIFVANMHPKSSGYMKLKSKNPYKWPRFYPQYFSDPGDNDIRTHLAGIREAQRIMSAPIMRRYGTKIVDTPIPGCECYLFDSDDYWLCALKHATTSFWHHIATNKMGPSDDPEAVVDSDLRVYGIKNLRVADTSVIPLPLTAHSTLPAYMIGEKAADLLKQSWSNEDNFINSKDIRSVGIKPDEELYL